MIYLSIVCTMAAPFVSRQILQHNKVTKINMVNVLHLCSAFLAPSWHPKALYKGLSLIHPFTHV